MKLELGPILYAGDSDATHWRFHVNMLFQGGGAERPPVTLVPRGEGMEIGEPRIAWDFSEVEGRVYWRWPVSVERGPEERRVAYEVSSEMELPDWLERAVSGVVIPRAGHLPRIAFFSCNGVEKLEDMRDLDDPFSLWADMFERHCREADEGEYHAGYHLLVGGGDQIYADSLWYQEPLDDYRVLPQRERATRPFPPEFRAQVRKHFVELYAKRWSATHMRRMMARVPVLFTWDDHDIRDGWGSYPRDMQESPVFRGVFEAAREAFYAFQVGGEAENRLWPRGGAPSTRRHLLQAATFPGTNRRLDLLLLDLRSERTRDQVLSEEQWRDLVGWMEEHRAAAASGERRHLVVVSTIPLVHLSYYGFIDTATGSSDALADDRIDQWEHPRHQGERARMVMRLLKHARDAGCQVTILSGDVHVGARGRIVSADPEHLPEGSARATIHQVTSSGIVNMPPSWIQMQVMRLAAEKGGKEFLRDEVYTELVDVTGGRQFLRARNWLSAVFDLHEEDESNPSARLWMKWFTDDGGIEPQVVVDPRIVP